MALISPGPNFALMLKIGLGSGRRAALRTVLGIAVGEAIWGLAAVFGVAALALHYPMVGTAIRWAGGLFLLRLGFGALRSAWRNTPPAAAATAVPGGFSTGLGIMLLNPKAGFFWISLTGVLLGPGLLPSLGLLAVGVAVLLSAVVAYGPGGGFLGQPTNPCLCEGTPRDRGGSRRCPDRPRRAISGDGLTTGVGCVLCFSGCRSRPPRTPVKRARSSPVRL